MDTYEGRKRLKNVESLARVSEDPSVRSLARKALNGGYHANPENGDLNSDRVITTCRI